MPCNAAYNALYDLMNNCNHSYNTYYMYLQYVLTVASLESVMH